MSSDTETPSHSLLTSDLGLIDYEAAHDVQCRTAARVEAEGIAGIVLLCEHRPVLTIGRLADRSDLGRDIEEWRREGVQVVETNRGGKITFHGPGQLVLYPIINLKKMGLDLHSYVRALEETGIRFLAEYGVSAVRDPEHTGVWVGDQKIAAIGVHVRRWIATHGMALNVNNASDMFRRFTPCGIHDKGVVSLCEILGRSVDMDEGRRGLLGAFGGVFGVSLVPDRSV